MRRKLGFLPALGFLVAPFWVNAARASEPVAIEYSDLEKRTLQTVLRTMKVSLEPAPSGKRIGRVRVVVQEVFDEFDPVPDFVNVFHTISKETVITRDLLFAEKDVFDPSKLDESARNLRALRQLSLVLIVPIQAPSKDEVDILVIVRDIWSLRLNSDFQIEGTRVVYHGGWKAWLSELLLPLPPNPYIGVFEFEGTRLRYLLLNPSEENLLGTHTNVGGLFVLTQANYSTGMVFGYPRIAGSHVAGSVNANLVFNRQTDQREGSFGSVFVGQPLYSADTRWAWAAGFQWRKDIFRAYKGGHPALVDLPSTEAVEQVPWRYRTFTLASGAEVLRSYGRNLKLDLSFGAEANTSSYRSFDLAGVAPEAAKEFVEQAIPHGASRISPVFQVRSYANRFAPLLEIDSLGLQEDYRLGPEALVRVFPAAEALGSSRDLLGLFAGVSYTEKLGDGLARAVASTRLELASRSRNDTAYEVTTHVASPHVLWGRLHHAGLLTLRPLNYSNRSIAIGGDNRLRGFPSGAFVGTQAATSNLEFRTRSVDILSAQVGAAAYYDVGAVFGGLAGVQHGQAVGAGVRALFPQLDRLVLRFDWAFPLGDRRYPALPGALFVSFGQAFSVPGLSSPSLVGGFF